MLKTSVVSGNSVNNVAPSSRRHLPAEPALRVAKGCRRYGHPNCLLILGRHTKEGDSEFVKAGEDAAGKQENGEKSAPARADQDRRIIIPL
jgi:hypothetical protein